MTQSQNPCLQTDKRPEEERESSMADRPEELSHGSPRNSYLLPTGDDFSIAVLCK